LRNVCTKFGADWNIFRYTNDDTTESITESQNDRITKSQNHRHKSYWSFRCLGGLKSPEKNFSSIGENKIKRSDNIILSFEQWTN